MPDLVDPHFLMRYPDPAVSDYRCVVDAAATRVVFERTLEANGPSPLHVLDLAAGPGAEPWPLNGIVPAARPDWCWATGKIAFMDGRAVYTQDTVFAAPVALPNTPNMAYPTWSPAGDFLVTENGTRMPGYPQPRTTRIDPASGAVLAQVVGSPRVWGGMPAVDPTDATRVAFAGERIDRRPAYDQDCNYIWIADETWRLDPGVAPVRPLEAGADATGPFLPQFQGRAPWFSPDGLWVVFESTRADPQGRLYALFIQSTRDGGPARQVTDIGWDAQHAKFYPDGRRLVATLRREPGREPRGIARLDVGAFVG